MDSSRASDAEEAPARPDPTGSAVNEQVDPSVPARLLSGRAGHAAAFPQAVLALQRAAGNRATAALLGSPSARPRERSLQRQSVPHAAGASDEVDALRYGDSEQILRQLRVVIAEAEQAAADPEIPAPVRTRLTALLPTLREEMNDLAARLREAGAERQPALANVGVLSSPVDMVAAALVGLVPRAEQTTAAVRAVGAAARGPAALGPLLLLLELGGVWGDGPTVTPLSDATDRAWRTLTTLDPATAEAMRRPATTTGVPVAVTSERTRRTEECPPNAPRYDPAATDEAVHQRFWNVPALLTARTGVEWSSAYQLRFTSVIASNTAVAVLVDSAGCVRGRGEGTFIRGDSTAHAEIQALTQLSLQPPPEPGCRLIVHVSARPCAAICAPAISLWAAGHGAVAEVRVWNKWSLLRDDGFLSICQGIVATQRARHGGGRRGSGRRAERDVEAAAPVLTA